MIHIDIPLLASLNQHFIIIIKISYFLAIDSKLQLKYFYLIQYEPYLDKTNVRKVTQQMMELFESFRSMNEITIVSIPRPSYFQSANGVSNWKKLKYLFEFRYFTCILN